MNFNPIRCAVALVFVLSSAMAGFAQTAETVPHYTATTVNTSSPGDIVRFDLLRWSTDAERDQLFEAVSSANDSALAGLLQRAPTIGYIWTTESAGYPLRYAYRVALADGGERIILAIDRPLGSFEPQRWKLSASAKPTDYSYTIIELHLSKAGLGEGKSSLTANVIADKDAKTIALENYPAVQVMFQGVKK
jgi:hypothetical protein